MDIVERLTTTSRADDDVYEVMGDARLEIEHLRAKIDALMLEYCPEKMTPEQVDEWGKAQRPVSPEVAAAIDAAMKET